MIKPWITWSGSVGYQFDKRVKMTLIVHNIFDRVGNIPYYSGGFEFIPTQQGDTYDGREVFLQINYKLD
jgi:outer membrane receptor protein involved in Fe transport